MISASRELEGVPLSKSKAVAVAGALLLIYIHMSCGDGNRSNASRSTFKLFTEGGITIMYSGLLPACMEVRPGIRPVAHWQASPVQDDPVCSRYTCLFLRSSLGRLVMCLVRK